MQPRISHLLCGKADLMQKVQLDGPGRSNVSCKSFADFLQEFPSAAAAVSIGARKPCSHDDDESTSAGSSDRESSPSHVSASASSSPASVTCEPTPESLVDLPWSPMLPPGLQPPPGLSPPGCKPCIAPPPGLEPGGPQAAAEAVSYSPKLFRRELTKILRDLAADRNVARAVHQVRGWCVPEARQAAEFMDILTRAAEENRGMARKLVFAFAASLAAGSGSAFEQAACLEGLRAFFADVYGDLCAEVPSLPVVTRRELLPALGSVLSRELLCEVLPAELRSQMDFGV